MKLLQFLAIMLISAYICTAADEPKAFVHPDKTPAKKVVQANEFINLKTPANQLQELNIAVVDSMANGYAFFGPNNYFMYEPTTGSLVYIRRGFVDMLKYTTYTGTDQKNNLFINISEDWGKTWGGGVIVYNEKDNKMDQARYPSIAPYAYQGGLYVAYNAPTVLEKQGGWTGYLTGFWNLNDGYYADKQDSTFKFNNYMYKWGLQVKSLAFTYGANEDQMIMACAGVSPMNEDLAEASNIGYRYTTDFTVLTETIPAAWTSAKFGAVSTAGYRANEVVGFERAGGKVYMAAHGNYINNDVSGRPTVGVSISEDNGQTWGEFDVCPFSIIRAYAVSQGADADSTLVPYTSKGFTVLDNGDFSFAVNLAEYNQAKTYENRLHQVVEVYKEGGVWGVRKIASIYGSWMTFRDYLDANGDPSNPGDLEIQISRTVDGKNLFAKWVDLIGVRDTVVQGVTYSLYSTTDIFVTSREVGKPSWFGVKNATNSALKDRVTAIPNLLPNNFQGVPFLSLATIINPNYTPTAQAAQADSVGGAQYILIQNYDYTVGVEEENTPCDFNIGGVYPNPADEMSNIDFTLAQNGNIEISIVNMLGQTALQLYSGFQTSGIHSLNFSTAGLPAGTYSCVLRMNGNVKSTLINVIR